jgi:hypothetical protein
MNTSSQENNRIGTVVAILIAIVTVLAALVTWRSSVAQDGAGDEALAGERATLNVEQTRALNYVNAYESYGAYTTYKRYMALGDLIEEEQANVSEEEALQLELKAVEAYNLAVANQGLFPNKFLKRDGSYDLPGELGEMWADAAKQKDLNPATHFALFLKLQKKSNWFLADLTILAIALVFFSLVESVSQRAKVLLTAFGSLFMLFGTVAAFLIEIRM